MTQTSSSAQERERRRHYRVRDHVALAVKRVPREAEPAALTSMHVARERFALSNVLLVQRESRLPSLRSIERRMPEVATYLKHLEQQIETVARVLGQGGAAMSQEPTHYVTLSSSGMSFSSERAFPVDSLLEVRLALFPKTIRLLLYARVVRVEDDLEPSQHEVSVEFCDLLDEDEELLIKHIHGVQMRSLHN